MPNDAFNRQTDVFGGAFPSDAARVTFPALYTDAGLRAGAEAGLVMQNLQFSYSQQVTRLYEIGSPAIYYVGGRTSGNAAVQRVLGPRRLSIAFYRTYGDICRAKTNQLHLSMSVGCEGERNSPVSWSLYFVVLTTIGVAMNAGDMLVNESMQMIFSSMVPE